MSHPMDIQPIALIEYPSIATMLELSLDVLGLAASLEPMTHLNHDSIRGTFD